jgi:predicted outer membrane repeat protein
MRYIILIFVLIFFNLGFAEIINVPEDYPTIQAAIDATVDNDTILVSPGIYYENMDYSGKSIVIASYYLLEHDPSYIEDTIIDGSQSGSVVTVQNNEGPGTAIEGFTIQNGNSNKGGGIFCDSVYFNLLNLRVINNESSDDGGGLFCRVSTIQVSNCIFNNNSAPDDGGGICTASDSYIDVDHSVFLNNIAGDNGGGIRTYASTANISDCLFYENHAIDNGGGIFLHYSDSFVDNCILYNNISSGGMSAIDMWSGTTEIQNCTITQNQSPNWGTVGFWDYATVDIVNTIIFNNQGYALYGHPNSITHISYCDIFTNTEDNFGGYFVQGNLGVIQGQNYNGDPSDQYFNIYLDPEFLDPENYNFQLTANSPCIDAGSPNLPPDEDGSISDIGALYFDPDYLYANFLVNVNEGVRPLTVDFTDISTIGPSGDPIIGWDWDFDNDETIDSSNQHPTFTYQEAGIYTIALSVNDGENYDTCIKTDFITVHDPVEADFEANILEGYLPLEVQFNDNSVGLAQFWHWDFNNDGVIESIQQDPTFTFSQPGTFSIALTTSDGVYTDTEIKVDYITVLEPLTANFTASPLQGAAPLEVQFTDLSWGDPIFWIWDLNNDGFSDSNEQNPIYIYDETGSYTISLEISDGFDLVTEIKFNYVVVDPSDVESEVIPLRTELLGNYPNPFNPETTLKYNLHEPADLQIQIFNYKGQLVRTIVDQYSEAGHYSTIWNGRDESGKFLPSGIYFYKMKVNGKTEAVKKCLMLK